jgi:hypothetical protein
MQRESAMVMATVASLGDDELSKPTKCEGWTRAHLSHEADPDAILDSIEVCVLRLQVSPGCPGLQIVAGEGEEWIVGDGSFTIEGYYDELLPFLARGQVEEGLQYEGELPTLPPW